MFIKNYQYIFIYFMISGTLIAISSNSWFLCWLGLEINLMSIIPLIMSHLSSKSTEAAIKYFIAQAIASIFIISFSSMNFLYSSMFSVQSFNSIITMALAMKLGMAPLHFWFPQVMILLNWFMCFIILTWQKIAPFILMTYFYDNYFFTLLIIFSALVGGLGGFNQMNLKLILTYSSIIHSSWMLMLISVNLNFWMNYFFIYMIISSTILFSSFFMKIHFLNEIYSSMESNTNKNMFSLNMMSLGGLPPFLGFYAKFMAIMSGLKLFSLWVIAFLIVMSLSSLFYYMKTIYNFSMNYANQMKSFFSFKNKISMNSFILLLSFSGNMLTPILVLLT